MFSYVMLGTNDLQGAIRFYDPLMELLGHPKAGRNEGGASWGTFSNNYTIGLCVGRPFNQQPAGVGNGTMVALNTRSFEHIQQLYELAISLGAGMKVYRGAGHNTDRDSIVLMYEIRTGISWRLCTMPMRVEQQTGSFRIVYENINAPDIVRE